MFEKWKENLDKGGECGALFVDLSKAFDYLQHDLLLAKLNAYGFDYKSPKLISSFLSNTKVVENRATQDTFFKFQGKLFLSFLCTLFLHIFDT